MTSLKQTRRAFAVHLLLMAVGMLLAGAAQAKTIYVPATYKTIQAAINAAVKGDVVIVAKGTYKENLDFKGKAITVQSTSPTDKTVVAATIIDGQKKGSVVTFKLGEKATSVLKGFTLTNGLAAYGGGVDCEAASSPTLTNNAITGNAATRGGGVLCLGGSSPTLTANTITKNSAATLGGGVYCHQSSPTLKANAITSNSATSSGGGVCCYQSAPTLTSNTITGNSAGTGLSYGGGVYCDQSSPALTSNIISGNSAWYGSGVCCYASSSPRLTSNTIASNKGIGSSSYGGGVYCDESAPTLTNNIVTTNSANSGGGMSCRSSSPRLTNNTLSANSARFGGALNCAASSSPALIGNLIYGNLATQDGGGIYCQRSSPVVINNTISGNSAIREGGGVSCFIGSSPILTNTIVALNSGKYGGGLAVQSTDFEKPVVTYCDVYGNTGGDYRNWPDQTGKKGNISKNPLFAWAAKGNFHEKSKGGRWNGSVWVKDTVQSPCINAGDPTSAFANEPSPNGGRVNMGAYGNTKYASKSAPTAPSGGLLLSAAAAEVSGGGAQLSLSLSAAASVEVRITNLAGRPVATLPASTLPEGMSTLLWNGKGKAGLRVPSGTYLVSVLARTEDGGQAQALSRLSLLR